MKFVDEARFCFGVDVIKKNDSKEGVRLAPFQCGRKKVVLHKKIMELADEETKRVKNLQGKPTP